MSTIQKEVNKVAFWTILLNILLGCFKVLAGLIGHSQAMLADGYHTFSDVLTTIMAYIGVKVANLKADENHPYGHERFEPVFSILMSLSLIGVGLFTIYKNIIILWSKQFVMPSYLALIAAAISILVKEWMYHYTLHKAKKINSSILKGDAWHHRSDALSSVATFIGISCAIIYPKLIFLDALMAIIVGLIIINVGASLYMDAIDQLVDKAAPNSLELEISKIVLDTPNVLGIHKLKTRIFASKIYIDIEIYVDGKLTVTEGHIIATAVHDQIESHLDQVKHCMVHVEPK